MRERGNEGLKAGWKSEEGREGLSEAIDDMSIAYMYTDNRCKLSPPPK